MKKQGTGNREQGTEDRGQRSEIRDQGTEPLRALLRAATPPVGQAEPGRDLWPAMQARLNEESGIAARLKVVPWFDWLLAGGVALFAVAAPASVPVLLYYL